MTTLALLATLTFPGGTPASLSQLIFNESGQPVMMADGLDQSVRAATISFSNPSELQDGVRRFFSIKNADTNTFGFGPAELSGIQFERRAVRFLLSSGVDAQLTTTNGGKLMVATLQLDSAQTSQYVTSEIGEEPEKDEFADARARIGMGKIEVKDGKVSFDSKTGSLTPQSIVAACTDKSMPIHWILAATPIEGFVQDGDPKIVLATLRSALGADPKLPDEIAPDPEILKKRLTGFWSRKAKSKRSNVVANANLNNALIRAMNKDEWAEFIKPQSPTVPKLAANTTQLFRAAVAAVELNLAKYPKLREQAARVDFRRGVTVSSNVRGYVQMSFYDSAGKPAYQASSNP